MINHHQAISTANQSINQHYHQINHHKSPLISSCHDSFITILISWFITIYIHINHHDQLLIFSRSISWFIMVIHHPWRHHPGGSPASPLARPMGTSEASWRAPSWRASGSPWWPWSSRPSRRAPRPGASSWTPRARRGRGADAGGAAVWRPGTWNGIYDGYMMVNRHQ